MSLHSVWGRKTIKSALDKWGDPFGSRKDEPLSEQGRKALSKYERGRPVSACGSRLEDSSQSTAPASGSRLLTHGPGEERGSCFPYDILGMAY